MVWAMQNLSGNSFSGYSTYFLEQAGLDTGLALDFTLGQYSINCVGVFGAWFLMSIGIGRRSLYLYGLCGLCAMLFILGFLGLAPEDHKKSALAGHRRNHARLGAVLPALRRHSVLLAGGGAIDAPAANQDRRAGPATCTTSSASCAAC